MRDSVFGLPGRLIYFAVFQLWSILALFLPHYGESIVWAVKIGKAVAEEAALRGGKE